MPSPDDINNTNNSPENSFDLTINKELSRRAGDVPDKLRLILSKQEDYDSLSSEDIGEIISSGEQTLILIIACNIDKLTEISENNISSLIYLGYFNQIKSYLEKHNLLEKYSNIVALRFITLGNIDCLARHLKDLSDLSFSIAKALIEEKEENVVLFNLNSFSIDALKELFIYFVKEEKLRNADFLLTKLGENQVSVEYLKQYRILTDPNNRIPKK